MKRGTRNKIEEVFMEMENTGVIGCPEVGDCTACALDTINQMYQKNKSRNYIGAVYCSSQDWDIAVQSGHLMIGFVDLPLSEEEGNIEVVKDIGITLAATLQKHGFEVLWNGDPRTRISVKVGRPKKDATSKTRG